MDTTGSSTESDPEYPDETSPGDWTQLPLVQVEGGFLGGLALGMVPFGGVIANAITDPGTKWAEIGRGVGEIFGGGFAFAVGVAGITGGGAASGTGILTLPGVALVVGSAALAAGGVANVQSGAERLRNALSMSSGSGPGPKAAAPTVRTPSRADAILKPGGVKLGTPGTSDRIRFLNGGKEAAQTLMSRLLGGGATRVTPPGSVAEVFELAEGGTVSLRTVSSTDGVVATIDVAIEGIGISKIKFLP